MNWKLSQWHPMCRQPAQILTRLPSVNPVQLVMERGEVVGLANHTELLSQVIPAGSKA